MQNPEVMVKIAKDTIWYVAIPTIKYIQDLGNYASYDIAAYDCFKRNIVAVVLDVTTDRNTALRLVNKFNRYQLSPIHLEDAIFDILE